MKKIIITICTSVALLSCNKNEMETQSSNSEIIRFNDVATRTVVSNASEITEFSVFADQNLGPDGTTQAHQWVSILQDERVYRDENNDFTYDNTRYWVNGRTFFFFGVYPYGTDVTRTESIDPQGQISFEYTVGVTIPYNASRDFLIAQTTIPVLVDAVDYPLVGMEFNHLLSQIVINVKKDAIYNATDSFIVTQVGISGISRNGTLVAAHSPNTYTESLNVVDESRQIRRQNLNASLTAAGVDVLGENNGMLVLPQVIKEGVAKLSIAYSYQQAADTELQYSTIEVDIPTEQVSQWESGKIYTYNLTLKIDNNIYISTPTVSNWGTAQSGGTIIIK